MSADFRRDDKGTPLVADPVQQAQPTGRKDELTAQCIALGLTIPEKATVADLKALLGPRPKIVPFSRPSGYIKLIENTYNLERWAERMVAIGIGVALSTPQKADAITLGPVFDERVRGELIALLVMDEQEQKAAADEIAMLAKDAAKANLAAQRGTHTHRLTELDDEGNDWLAIAEQGELLDLPLDVQKRCVEAWRALLDQYGLKVIATEATVINDEFRAAGTLDRVCVLTRELRFLRETGEIVTLPAGLVVVLDIKTGQLRVLDWWNGYAAQVYLYASGVPYDTERDLRGEWPQPISTSWALIAHLDVLAALEGAEEIATLLLVDLARGRAACEIAKAAKAWSRQSDVFARLYEIAPESAVTPGPVECLGGEAVAVHGLPPAEEVVRLTGSEQRAAVPTAPAEGELITDPMPWSELEFDYLALGDNGRAFCKSMLVESKQGQVSFHQSGQKSRRRLNLYRALFAFAGHCLPDGDDWSEAEELMRGAIALVVDQQWPLFPTIKVGHAFGALDADEASTLTFVVGEIIAGRYAAVVKGERLTLSRVA